VPVLGGSSSSGAGTTRRGVYVPAGSLDVAKAAVLASGTARTEWVIFGDSTSAGSASSNPGGGGKNPYSWITKLRALMAAAYTDGGRGVVGVEDIGISTLDIVDNISGVQSAGAWTSATSNDQLLTSSFSSSTTNDPLVLQGYATSARINYSRQGIRAGFTYAVNGGAETTVDADFNGFSIDSVLITGMPSAALNTVTIKNLGTALVRAPGTVTAAGSTASGTLPAGTYFYKVTAVDSVGGQTLPVAASASVTLGSAGTATVQVNGTIGSAIFTNATSYSLYRSTTSNGTFQLVRTVTSAGDGSTSLVDDGSFTLGATAPTSATSARNVVSGRASTAVAVDMLKSTGITIHKQAISGISSNSYFGYANPTNYGAFQA
jgi:hypothetical protein